jgi:hypothetical protein
MKGVAADVLRRECDGGEGSPAAGRPRLLSGTSEHSARDLASRAREVLWLTIWGDLTHTMAWHGCNRNSRTDVDYVHEVLA